MGGWSHLCSLFFPSLIPLLRLACFTALLPCTFRRQGMLAVCREARPTRSAQTGADASYQQREGKDLEALHAQVDRVERCLLGVSAVEQSRRRCEDVRAPVERSERVRISVAVSPKGLLVEQGPGPGRMGAEQGVPSAAMSACQHTDLPVFEQLFKAAAELSVEQVRVLSLEGSDDSQHGEAAHTWAEAQGIFFPAPPGCICNPHTSRPTKESCMSTRRFCLAVVHWGRGGRE